MAKNITVQIDGWEELERKLKALGEHINAQEVLEESLMEGAEIMKGAIKARAPYKSGQLQSSISISKKGRQKYSVRIGPDKTGFYGRMQELGTSKQPARPFMRPAFDAQAKEVQRVIEAAIWRKVEEAAESNA